MTPARTDKLRSRYPTVLGNLQGSIDCGNGWFRLVNESAARLERINRGLPSRWIAYAAGCIDYPPHDPMEIRSISTFAGLLRIDYDDDPTGYLEKLAEEMANRSAEICEHCGRFGYMGAGRVLCRYHRSFWPVFFGND